MPIPWSFLKSNIAFSPFGVVKNCQKSLDLAWETDCFSSDPGSCQCLCDEAAFQERNGPFLRESLPTLNRVSSQSATQLPETPPKPATTDLKQQPTK
jgi:hypothetical protein